MCLTSIKRNKEKEKKKKFFLTQKYLFLCVLFGTNPPFSMVLMKWNYLLQVYAYSFCITHIIESKYLKKKFAFKNFLSHLKIRKWKEKKESFTYYVPLGEGKMPV